MNKKYLLVTTFLIALVVVGGYFVSKIPSDSANIDTTSTDTLGAETSGVNMNEKLEIQDEVVGTGTEAVNGKTITVNYSGTLADGTAFDSNVDPKFGHVEPFTFILGAGEVIQGWDQGFTGMKVGGKRKLTIPPSLGYGSADMGVIPPNSTLIFEVELLKVE
jgi:FKBP-type peptidyl-prolyl cis-trans isomerase